jgi:hypothetical protein
MGNQSFGKSLLVLVASSFSKYPKKKKKKWSWSATEAVTDYSSDQLSRTRWY